MTEQLDLTIPTPAASGRNNYRVDELTLDWGRSRIDVWLLADNGERLQHVYRDQQAADLMLALNTADLAQASLHRRILDRLVADGILAGTVSGAPE